jgi:hypothetical protein
MLPTHAWDGQNTKSKQSSRGMGKCLEHSDDTQNGIAKVTFHSQQQKTNKLELKNYATMKNVQL